MFGNKESNAYGSLACKGRSSGSNFRSIIFDFGKTTQTFASTYIPCTGLYDFCNGRSSTCKNDDELAKKHGSKTPPKLLFGDSTTRTVLELAIENVVEGCVREGFAALQALYQSRHAKNVELRSTMAQFFVMRPNT